MRLRMDAGTGALVSAQVTLNTALMFSKASDEWSTPQAFFDLLDDEFGFAIDVAATRHNTKCAGYFGPDGLEDDALLADWGRALKAVEDGTWRSIFWMNPPYSRCREFIALASIKARLRGYTTVCLVPSRTDTRWWHDHVWDRESNGYRPGVEVRFVKGRLKFGGAKAGAPFPSVVVIFRPY